jgi:hypothetical protein
MGKPSTGFQPGGWISPTSVPLRIRWEAATDEGSGVARYEVAHSQDGAPWQPVADPSDRNAAKVRVRPGSISESRVRAVDGAGNASDWQASAPALVKLQSERSGSASFDPGWRTRSSSAYLGGEARSTTTPGATVRHRSTGTAMAIIASRGPDGGSATVYVDGLIDATVSFAAATALHRRLVYERAWSTAETRVVEVVFEGSAGKRADIDGFLVANVPPTVTLVGAGDIASCSSSGDEATAALVESIPGIVFTAGDNAYSSGTAEQFANCYHPSWGRFRDRTRPAPGNHDHGTAGAAGYFSYFGAQAGPAGRGWYAYDAGTWRVYSLDSDCAFVGGCRGGSPQFEWLAADLAAHPKRCVLAYWHHPRHSSGPHGGSTVMGGILKRLYAAGADVVINGHDHDYERFAPATPDGLADPVTGIRQFVVGTGGASLYAVGPAIAPNSEVRDGSTYGVIRLTLGSDAYAWEFIPVEGGTFTDAGAGACH